VKLYIVLIKLNLKRKNNCTTSKELREPITSTKRVYSYCTSVHYGDDVIQHTVALSTNVQ